MRHHDPRMSALYVVYLLSTASAFCGLVRLGDAMAALAERHSRAEHLNWFYLGVAFLGIWLVLEPTIAGMAAPMLRVAVRFIVGVLGLSQVSAYVVGWLVAYTPVYHSGGTTFRFFFVLVGGHCVGQVLADVGRFFRGGFTRDIFEK